MRVRFPALLRFIFQVGVKRRRRMQCASTVCQEGSRVVKQIKSGSLLLCLIMAMASGVLYAAPAESQGDAAAYKIGVVDVKQVFDNYERQKQEYARLQEERDKKQAEIDKLSEKITAAKERYDKERATMTDEARRALEEQIEADYSKYKADFKLMQEDIDRREQRLLEQVFEDIHVAIQEVGARGDFHLVLEAGQPGRTSVLYHSTTLDITQRVTDHINKKYSGGS